MTDIKKERKVKDFSKGMIYRIVCNITGDVYIGSSAQTCAQRLSKHVDKYKQWKKDNAKVYYSSFIIIARNDYKIILVESYPCKNNDELFSREQFWMEQTECVNKKRAHNTPYQNQEYDKQYNKDNAERISECMKKRYIANKDTILLQTAEWKKNNKEHIKQYYQNNAERISERNKQVITCECGSEVTQCNKLRHNKSQKHINFTQA